LAVLCAFLLASSARAHAQEAADADAGIDDRERDGTDAGAPPDAATDAPVGEAAADSGADGISSEASEPVDVDAIEQALAADAADTASASTERSGAPATESGPTTGPAITQSMNPDISVILDVAGALFSKDENLQAGAHDPTEDGFNLQQLELAIGAAVDPYFRLDGNLVFSLFGVELEEFYATTLDLPAQLQLRAGQFLTRFGRINATHPHSWSFVDQPFVMSRVFGGEGGRGLGVEASWLTPLPWYVELIGSANMAAGAATARSFFGADDLGVDGADDLLYTTAVEQFFALSDDWSLLWGLSGAFGPNATGRNNRTELYGTDVYLKWRPLSGASVQIVSLELEAIYRRRQVPSDVLADVGGYAQLFFRFAQRWAVAGRFEWGTPAYGLGGEVVDDYLDPDWIDHRTRVSANLTFWPTEFSRLRAQASMDRPAWLEGPIWAGFLAAEFLVGAHGAHRF
jgi:hypothetical protein